MDIASVRSVRGTSQRYQMQVHDRYITSPRQVHDRLNQIQSLRGDTGKPLRHDAAARAASRSAGSVARHGTVPVFHPAAGDAHSVTASVAASMGWRGPIRQPAPAAGTNKTSPPPSASRTAENRPHQDARHAPVRRAVRAPV